MISRQSEERNAAKEGAEEQQQIDRLLSSKLHKQESIDFYNSNRELIDNLNLEIKIHQPQVFQPQTKNSMMRGLKRIRRRDIGNKDYGKLLQQKYNYINKMKRNSGSNRRKTGNSNARSRNRTANISRRNKTQLAYPSYNSRQNFAQQFQANTSNRQHPEKVQYPLFPNPNLQASSRKVGNEYRRQPLTSIFQPTQNAQSFEGSTFLSQQKLPNSSQIQPNYAYHQRIMNQNIRNQIQFKLS